MDISIIIFIKFSKEWYNKFYKHRLENKIGI